MPCRPPVHVPSERIKQNAWGRGGEVCFQTAPKRICLAELHIYIYIMMMTMFSTRYVHTGIIRTYNEKSARKKSQTRAAGKGNLLLCRTDLPGVPGISFVWEESKETSVHDTMWWWCVVWYYEYSSSIRIVGVEERKGRWKTGQSTTIIHKRQQSKNIGTNVSRTTAKQKQRQHAQRQQRQPKNIINKN